MRLAERGAAIHTSCRLYLLFDGRVLLVVAALDGVELLPVQDAFGGIAVGFLVAMVVDEASELFDRLVRAVAALYSG